MSPSMNIYCSNSEPNVCLVDNSTPTKSNMDRESKHSSTAFRVIDSIYAEVGTSKDGDDDSTIQVQRSVAFHELIDSKRKLLSLDDCANTIDEIDSKIFSPIHSDEDRNDHRTDGNAKILKLTRNKWLSESRDGSPDAREALFTSASETSSFSEDQEDHSTADKVLSTVLALDNEHNLFGLSHIKIAGPKEWKKMGNIKESKSKAVYHQTAIVQVCSRRCCRRVSKSDLPESLKCGGRVSKCSSSRCGSCSSACSPCVSTCGVPCGKLCATPCSKPCGPPDAPCMDSCRKPRMRPCPPCPIFGCSPSACDAYCTRLGLQMMVYKRPEYEPTYTELEPKSSCILHKPMAARSCNHTPRCLPPSSCCPYLMPCYWPSRAGAPCNEPSRCFHNPPCPKRRPPTSKIDPGELCPVDHPCTGTKKEAGKCENLSCIGRGNEALKKALAEKYK